MKIFNSFGLIVTKPPVRSCLSEISVSTKYTVKSEASMWSDVVSENLISFNLVEFEFVIYSVLIAALNDLL